MTCRRCIRKKPLQVLLNVVLLVMVGSESCRVSVGLMSATRQMGTRGSFVISFFSIYLTSVPPRPPISLIVSRSARPLPLRARPFSFRSPPAVTLLPLCLSVGLGNIFFPSLHLFSHHFVPSMFTYAPRLVQQRAAPPVYERIPSQVPPSVPRSRTPSVHQPIPTRHPQMPSPPSIPVPRHSPELWVDALKEDVEAEFNLTLVDDVKAVKDAALASATTPEEKVAIQREYDESMADIRALARAELQRRVEAERERRLLSNFHGKDALVAEQHTIMDSILRENMRGDVPYSFPSSSSLPQQDPSPLAQPQPQFSRQSQPIPIPMQRSSSRNGVPRGSSVGGRSVSIGNGPVASSSSSSSPRAFPSVRRDSITHASARPLPPPIASPASSLSSVSGPSESSSVGSTHDKMERRYQEHRVAVQKRENEVRLKEAAALRYAEEARRREEAAARHEENARRKNEEATRRIREAELREQHVRALEARTRKEIAQKEAGVVRTRARVPSTASAAVPRMTRVYSEEWQQQRLRAGTGVATIPTPIAVPRGEVRVRF